MIKGRDSAKEKGLEDGFLDRPLYSVREAARLLTVPSGKLRRWLDGAVVSGTRYPPVIREEVTHSDAVTWAEFVEAGFLREYRGRRVSLQHMRQMIEALREDYGVRYPLAHFAPLVDPTKRHLVPQVEAHGDSAEGPDLMRRVGGSWQLQWRAAVQAFLDKVEFSPQGIAERMHPLGHEVPVVIDPQVAFGIPQVRGVRTETIAEALAWGDTEEHIAESWGLTIADVKAAIRWEMTLKQAA